MSRDKQIEEMTKDISEKQSGGWVFIADSEYTTDIGNKELAKHLVINKDYRKASEVAAEIFEEIDKQIAFFRMYMFLNSGVKAIVNVLDELKKKYTEGEG